VKRKMSVPLPPNFKNKQILTYDGQGSYDPHARAYKDLYIQLHHALPKGVKLDLAGGVHVNVPVTLADVFLGFHKVLSLYGEPVDVICEGPVDPSAPIVVKERGLPLPLPAGSRSAIIVHLVVSYPKHEDMVKMRPLFGKIFKKHGPMAEATHPNPIVL
jgi:DnaJ-class molecular chaperone